jgi:hypothetical protein
MINSSLLPVIAIAALASVAATAPAAAECLSSGEARAVVSSGQAQESSTVWRALAREFPGKLLKISLCRSGRGLVYNFTVLSPADRVHTIEVDASSGAILDVF